jgi:hypothetical protein
MPEDTPKNNDIKESSEEVRPPKKKRSTQLKILQIFAFVVTLFVLIIIGLVIFIQTDTFNKWALEFTIDKMNDEWKQKEATIYAKDIEGNIFTGIELLDGNIVLKGDTLIQYEFLRVKYDLWPLLQREITIDSLVFERPIINLTKIYDSQGDLVWNIGYLFTPEEDVVDTTESIFDWRVVANNVIINDAMVRIVENKEKGIPFYNVKMDRIDEFGLRNLMLTDFNLILSADYYFDRKIFNVKDLRFNTNSEFNLKNLTFNMEMLLGNDTTTVLKNFVLITDRSNVNIADASMEKLNLLGDINYEEWKDKDVNINFLADKFDFKDLVFFIPSVDFLDSTVYLNLNASGKYGDLNIHKLDLRLPNSEINLHGNLKNLHEPADLLYDITGNDIKIDPTDTRRVLPGLDIPDFSNLGFTNIPYLTYKGESTRFDTEFDIQTALAGSARGNVYFDFDQPQTYYRGEASTVNLDLARILKDDDLKSRINADLIFDARGFEPEIMSGRINIDMRSSQFMNFDIARSTGQYNLHSGNLEMNMNIASNAMTGQVTGTLKNFMNPENMSYNVRGSARGLNIGVFANDNSLNSDLNLTFDINGSGIDINNISGNFKLNLAQSRFKDLILPPTPLIAILDQRSAVKNLDISSDFVNLKAHGRFTFDGLFSAIEDNFSKISNEFTSSFERDTISSLDTTAIRERSEQVKMVSTIQSSNADLDFNYNLQIKNISSLSSFTGFDTTTNMSGNIVGYVRRQNNFFNMKLDADLNNFRYNDSLFFVRHALINFDAMNDMSGRELYGLDARLNFFADSLVLNNISFDTTRINLDLFNNANRFLLSSSLDSTVKLYTEGRIGYAQAPVIVMDSLAFTYNEFLIRNQDELVLKYHSSEEKSGIEFEKFTIKEDFQRVSVEGFYSFEDNSDLTILADNIELGEYQRMLSGYVSKDSELSGNIRRLEVNFKQSLDNPIIHLEANSDIIKMGGTVIGRLDAIIDYEDEVIKPHLEFYNANNEGSFFLTGSVPFQNPFGDDTISFLSQPVDLRAEANNFQMKLIQQLLPQVSDLEGFMNGVIDVKGTVQSPLLTGSMKIQNGAFTVDLTGVRYNFEADINTEEEKLIIPYSKIYVPDESDIFINATGFIDFTDLTIKEMELFFTGDVKVLDKSYGMTSLGIEGDLYIGSGIPKLQLTGRDGNFELSGEIVLSRGNVTINPFIQEAYNIYADQFIYGVIIDSSFEKGDSVRTILFENPDTLLITKDRSLNPFEIILNQGEVISRQVRHPQGIFFYDVHVTTTDKFFLTFIVNEKTRQEFFGRIDADLYVNNKNPEQKMTARGVIHLGDNSYYRFFKKFNANGQVVFNGEITNPVLVIDAEYSSRVPSDEPGAQTLSDVIIELKVRGEARNPTLSISVLKDGVPITGSDATSDALSLLLFGQFKTNIGYNERSSLVGGLGANIGSIFLSDYISSAVENIFPFILNTDVNYVETKEGTFVENTDIRFTAELGDAVIRFGGRFFSGIGNTDIIIEYPLNRLFGYRGIYRNLVIQLERIVDPFATSAETATYRDESRTGGLLYYRIKF